MHVVVIGGGIAGLSAAWTLARSHEQPSVTLLEQNDRWGGKIRTDQFAGHRVDAAADAFLARVPWAIELCEQLGLRDSLIPQSQTRAWLWVNGTLKPFPADTVLGIPSNLDSLRGLISPEGIARAEQDRALAQGIGRSNADLSIGQLVRTRLGDEIAEVLVDPLVGGINAGSIDSLSLRTASPQLTTLADIGPSLIDAAAEQRQRDMSTDPLFLAPPDGMQTLVDALVQQLATQRVRLELNTPVRSLERSGNGWAINGIDADAVVLAIPAFAAANLLRSIDADAARELAAIHYASVAMIRLAYRAHDVGVSLDGSGFLVPARDQGTITACSWASSKWQRLSSDDDTVIFRASAGRFGDDSALRLSDDELVAAAHLELTQILGLTGQPTATDVTRWLDSFPQYEPGHGERLTTVDRALVGHGRLALAGAAYLGIGIPACIKSGIDAAHRVTA